MKIQPDCINCKFLSAGEVCQRIKSGMYALRPLVLGCRYCGHWEPLRRKLSLDELLSERLPQPHRSSS